MGARLLLLSFDCPAVAGGGRSRLSAVPRMSSGAPRVRPPASSVRASAATAARGNLPHHTSVVVTKGRSSPTPILLKEAKTQVPHQLKGSSTHPRQTERKAFNTLKDTEVPKLEKKSTSLSSLRSSTHTLPGTTGLHAYWRCQEAEIERGDWAGSRGYDPPRMRQPWMLGVEAGPCPHHPHVISSGQLLQLVFGVLQSSHHVLLVDHLPFLDES